MKRIDRKSKMISFRLSPAEYSRLVDACRLRGIENVSELARNSMQQVLNATPGEASFSRELEELRARALSLSREIEQLARRLDQAIETPAPRAQSASAYD